MGGLEGEVVCVTGEEGKRVGDSQLLGIPRHPEGRRMGSG